MYYMIYMRLKEAVEASPPLSLSLWGWGRGEEDGGKQGGPPALGEPRQRQPSFLVNFGCGVVAATAATLLTQPADVVR